MERRSVLVAGKTKLGAVLMQQHVAVDRTVRVVAGHAALDPDGAVLIDKRPLFVGVAAVARLLVETS